MNTHRQFAVCFGILALAACHDPSGPAARTGSPLVGSPAVANAFANSEWSEPVNIGAPVNSPANETNAAFSPDELAIYFTSNRPGTLGLTDIWVAERACLDCPWQAPVNLAALNTLGSEAGPRLSNDGHLLFFQSDKPGGQGSFDIYVTRRSNTHDNFSWGEPTALGLGVNTAEVEQAAVYLPSAEEGQGSLYFNRGPALAQGDIYYAAVTRDGETLGDAVFVAELTDAAAFDQHVTLRKDAHEVFIASTRAGGLGGFDIWTSTRQNVNDPWSPIQNAGLPLSTTFNDMQPSLTSDSRTMLFTSNRPGGVGGNDLWVSRRTPNGK
jgi:hypothetical protein